MSEKGRGKQKSAIGLPGESLASYDRRLPSREMCVLMLRRGGSASSAGRRPSSAERRRAYSESLRERQGLSPSVGPRRRHNGESGSEAEHSDRSSSSRGKAGRRKASAAGKGRPSARKSKAPPKTAWTGDNDSLYSQESMTNAKYDTGAEIADIDSRLNALQSATNVDGLAFCLFVIFDLACCAGFLRAAKDSV